MGSSAHDLNRDRQWACARRMCDRRHELGLTQCEVVERLVALGVPATNRTWSAMEHGQGVDVGRLPEVAVALDCTVTYLLGLTAEPHRWMPDHLQVPVTVAAQNESVRASWILGPDIPDLHVSEIAETRGA